MNEIILKALLARVKAGDMEIEQIPIPYQTEITRLMSED